MNTFERSLNIGFRLSQIQLNKVIREYQDLTKSKVFTLDKNEVDTQLIDFLDELNLSISHAEAFYTCPGRFTSIHVDGKQFDQHTKLNWVYGAPGSKMHWYKLKDNAAQQDYETVIGTKALYFNKEDCELVHSAEVGLPSLVNVGGPHNVENCTDEQRWCLSFVLWDNVHNNRLEWPEAVKIFSQFFI